MKKQLLIISSFLLGLNSFSQITINSGDFPQSNDTVMVSVSEQYGTIDFSQTGANQVWDYSSLYAISQRVDTFYAAPNSFSTYGFVYNSFLDPDYQADYYNTLTGSAIPEIPFNIITIENPVYFTKNTSSSSQILGLGLEINGVEVPAKADTTDIVYQLPFEFNDSWDSTSYLYLDINPVYDAKFKRHQSRTSVVDGWGEITTPFGTFDALRVKSEVIYTDSVYFDLGFGAAWNELPTPSDVEYTWWTNNNKIPVLKIVAQNGTSSLIEYRDREVVIGAGISDLKEGLSFNVYPNPADQMLNVSSSEKSKGIVELIDMTGRVIYTSKISDGNHAINTERFESGMYLVKLTSDAKTSSKTIFIK